MAQFKGSIVALVSPFKNGAVDFDAYQRLVEWHVESGTHGIVPCGTTGETPTISEDEHKKLIDACIEAATGRVKVIAGAGSNATDTAIDFARHAEKAGADGILVVTPYYNKPTQEGMYQHFKAVHDAVKVPIILYNVPGRTGVELDVDTTVRLANDLPRIAGIKDASVDLSRPLQMRTAIEKPFALISGEDATVAAYLAQGGDGCISVTANVAPALCAQLHNSWMEKDWETFTRVRDVLLPLHKALFMEPNPSPAKYCLSRLGRCEEDVRMPLMPVLPETRAVLDEAMKHAGLFGAMPAKQAAG